MTKPVIIKREVKGTPLTYAELDTNFQNLDDATINFTGDLGDTRSMDLNDTTSITGDPTHNIKVTVSESGQSIVIDNTLGNYTREPMGFENRTDSVMSFNAGLRQFTIQPASTSYRVWIQGKEFVKTTSQSVTILNQSDLYYLYFDSAGALQYGTSFDFGQHCPISAVQWNASTGQYYFLGEERHGISMDWATHEYLNAVNGLRWASGFNATNYTTSGDGSANAHAQIDLTSGVVYQEDIKISVAHSNTPDYSLFQQDIAGPGRFPVTYHSGATGEWVKDSATDYPVKYITSRIAYNLNTAGTWTAQEATNNHYVAMWLVATSNVKDGPICALMGQREDSNIGNAQDNNVFSNLDLTNFPGSETRPLYRLIFQTGSYGNAVNARLVDITDVRSETIQATLTASAAGISNVSEDLNPQLGGDLDVNGYSIVSISNGNIALAPNGTGRVVLDGQSWPSADGTANQYLKTDGAGNLSWSSVSGGLANVVEDLSPQLGGSLDLNTYRIVSGNLDVLWMSSVGINNTIVLGNGAGNLIQVQDNLVFSGNRYIQTLVGNSLNLRSIKTNNTTGASLTLSGDSNGNITVTADGTGKIHLASELRLTSTTGAPTNYENTYFEGSLAEPVTWLKVQLGEVTARTARSITALGNAATSATQNKFGGYSLALDGTGDSLTVPTSPDFAFASGTYTFECWLYRTAGGTYQTVFDFRSASPSGPGIVVGIDNNNGLYIYNNYGFRIGPTTANTIPLNTWCHLAVAHDGTGLRAFVNGSQVGATYNGAVSLGTSQPLFIGGDPNNQYNFYGYMDEIRISNSARYTGTFTPSASAFINDNNTLLLIHADTTIADDNSDSVYYLPLFK